jgi:hypothetical protein
MRRLRAPVSPAAANGSVSVGPANAGVGATASAAIVTRAASERIIGASSGVVAVTTKDAGAAAAFVGWVTDAG